VIVLSEYLDPYRRAVEEHGAGFEATLWGTRRAQLMRFDVMSGLVDFDSRVIFDAGCGQGDLAAHLLEQRVDFTRYVGVDAMAEMIDAADKRNLDRSTFHAADILSDATVLTEAAPDVVCISGTMNTMDDETARRLVTTCFESVSEAVVFNFLSDRAHERWDGRDLTPARRFETTAWIDWALSLTSRVAFTQAYLDGHDATIAIWHD